MKKLVLIIFKRSKLSDCYDRYPSFAQSRIFIGTERDRAAHEQWDEKRRTIRVEFQGELGPLFHRLHSGAIHNAFVYTTDGATCGYIGIQYPSWLLKPVEWIEKRMDKAGDKAWWPWLFIPFMSPYLLGPWIDRGSRRSIPVRNTKKWKKSYTSAWDPFFTPTGRLVVTAKTTTFLGTRIVIDEQAGPVFDKIFNVRYLDSEQAVCYLGKSGQDFYRVLAPC